MARMHQREEDVAVAYDVREYQGDIDDEYHEVLYNEEQAYRRELAEREPWFYREQLDIIKKESDGEDVSVHRNDNGT